MPMLTGHTRLAGVIGWPIAHSRSPRLHNHWLARHGIDGAYVPLPVRPEGLPDAVRGLRAAGFAGFNATIPHKEALFALCDRLLEPALRAGAVNTVVFEASGAITGTNTDGAGYLASLRAEGVEPAAGPALLLGAGGAARAIAAALLDAGAPVTVTNRTLERAEALVEALPGLRVLPWGRREEGLADHALVVNTTSLGMSGGRALELSLDRAPAGMAVSDIVYVPRRTALLKAAEARGLRAVEGLGMLLHQAVPGFAAWFGATPEVDRDTYELVASDIPLDEA